MITKIEQLRTAANSNDWIRALSIASRFQRLGDDKKVIEQAHGCLTNPTFYKQIGVDTDKAVKEGIDTLIHKYDLQAA